MVDFNHKVDERSTGLDDLEVFFLDNIAIYSTATRLSSTFLFIFVLHRKKTMDAVAHLSSVCRPWHIIDP